MSVSPPKSASTLSPAGVLDLYFLDARSKLIEIAAFLDRVVRARGATPGANAGEDFRLAAFNDALAIVAGDGVDKARRVQMIFSDPTTEPLASAEGMKGASGAYPGRRK